MMLTLTALSYWGQVCSRRSPSEARVVRGGALRVTVKWASIWMAMALVSACRPGVAQVTPPEIRYGVESCAHCRMIISDPRFAAGYVHEVAEGRYESLAFDDIGDMLDHAQNHPERRIVAWYVHDYATEAWLDATEAHYTLSHGIRSPMAAGLAAHAHAQQAQEMAMLHDGTMLDWPALLAVAETGGDIDLGDHEHN